MKTSTINYLILYGLEPSSDPKPENEPSKSAARPPSMSSDLMWFSQFDRAWDMSLLSAAVLHIKQEATSSKMFATAGMILLANQLLPCTFSNILSVV